MSICPSRRILVAEGVDMEILEVASGDIKSS